MLSVRKIRTYDEDFDVNEFAEEAVEIYRTAHEALTRRDKAVLHANVSGGSRGPQVGGVTCRALARVVKDDGRRIWASEPRFKDKTVGWKMSHATAIFF